MTNRISFPFVVIFGILSFGMLFYECSQFSDNTHGELLDEKPVLKIIPFRDGDLWGFKKVDGSTAIEPQFSHAFLSWDGYGRVEKDGLTGLVSPEGEILVEPRYNYINPYSEKRASFNIGAGLHGFLNEKGEEIIPPLYDEVQDFYNQRAFVQRNENWYLIDVNGREIKPMGELQSYFLDYFMETPGMSYRYDKDVIPVMQKNSYLVGLIDTMGNMILDPVYHSLSKPFEGVLVASRGEYMGLIDRSGKTITPMNFEFLSRVDDRSFIGQRQGKTGVINQTGNTLIPFEYDYINTIPNNRFIASKNGKSGVIDTSGAVILPFQYNSLYYDHGYFIFYDEEFMSGVIDLDGNTILEPLYTHIQVLDKDRFLAEKDQKSGIVGKNGKIILSFEYDISLYGTDGEAAFDYQDIPRKFVLLEKNHEAFIFNADGKKISDKKWQYVGYPDRFGLVVAFDAALNETYISNEGKLYSKDKTIKKINVGNAQEFFDAIGKDTEIILQSGEYNLNEIQGINEYAEVNTYDGAGSLVIRNVHNLTIRASEKGGAHIFTTSAFIPVIRLEASNNVILDGLKMGHEIEPGLCEGSVIATESVNYLYLMNVDLYGSGTYGLEANYSSRIIMKNSTIRECTYGIVYLQGVHNSGFYGCIMKDNGQFDLVEMHGSNTIIFENVQFVNNMVSDEWGPYAFFKTGESFETVTLNQCIFENCSADYFSNHEKSIILKGTSLSGLTLIEGKYSDLQ